MSDSPIPKRERLASSSGAMAAVRPQDLTRAVDQLQDDVATVRTIVKIHTGRLDTQDERHDAMLAKLEVIRAECSKGNQEVQAQIMAMRLESAKREGKEAALKWVIGLVPTLIAVGSALIAWLH